MLSDEGADYLFGFTIKADEKDYHVSLPGRAIKVLGDEQAQSVRANPDEKNNGALWTAFDDILWARRCFRKAREMVTTQVMMRRGMRR